MITRWTGLMPLGLVLGLLGLVQWVSVIPAKADDAPVLSVGQGISNSAQPPAKILDMILLVDISSSMTGPYQLLSSDLNDVKERLRVKVCESPCRLSGVVFGKEVSTTVVFKDIMQWTAKDISNTLPIERNLAINQGTNFRLALETALSLFENDSNSKADHERRVILFSDTRFQNFEQGIDQPSAGEKAELEILAAKFAQRQIKLNVLDIVPYTAHDGWWSALARSTGGEYISLNKDDRPGIARNFALAFQADKVCRVVSYSSPCLLLATPYEILAFDTSVSFFVPYYDPNQALIATVVSELGKEYRMVRNTAANRFELFLKDPPIGKYQIRVNLPPNTETRNEYVVLDAIQTQTRSFELQLATSPEIAPMGMPLTMMVKVLNANDRSSAKDEDAARFTISAWLHENAITKTEKGRFVQSIEIGTYNKTCHCFAAKLDNVPLGKYQVWVQGEVIGSAGLSVEPVQVQRGGIPELAKLTFDYDNADPREFRPLSVTVEIRNFDALSNISEVPLELQVLGAGNAVITPISVWCKTAVCPIIVPELRSAGIYTLQVTLREGKTDLGLSFPSSLKVLQVIVDPENWTRKKRKVR